VQIDVLRVEQQCGARHRCVTKLFDTHTKRAAVEVASEFDALDGQDEMVN